MKTHREQIEAWAQAAGIDRDKRAELLRLLATQIEHYRPPRRPAPGAAMRRTVRALGRLRDALADALADPFAVGLIEADALADVYANAAERDGFFKWLCAGCTANARALRSLHDGAAVTLSKLSARAGRPHNAVVITSALVTVDALERAGLSTEVPRRAANPQGPFVALVEIVARGFGATIEDGANVRASVEKALKMRADARKRPRRRARARA